MVNSFSELERKKFDNWVRMKLDECKGDEDCYEFVWGQILIRLGDPSRKMSGYRFKGRLRGFLDIAHKIIPGKTPLQSSQGIPKSGVEREVMLRWDK